LSYRPPVRATGAPARAGRDRRAPTYRSSRPSGPGRRPRRPGRPRPTPRPSSGRRRRWAG